MINPCSARNVINVVILAGLIGAPGCASNQPPMSEILMVKTPTIGVVLRPTDSDAELQIPRNGWGWLSNAGRGAMSGSLLGAYGVQCGFGLLLCVPAFATVGVIGGAIYGAVTAEPAAEWEQAESAFTGVLSDLNIQQKVPGHVVEFATNQTPYRIVRVENQDASSKDEKAAYRALASKGIDAVIELTELTIYLRPSSIDVNPTRTMVMATHARLIRTSDGALLDKRVITDDHSRAAWSLETWANPNEQAFREEVTQAAQRLAQQIVKELISDTHSSNDVQVPSLQALNR
jgi:hypothetical protein